MLPCHGCAYSREIPGDAHSRCVYNWAKKPEAIPESHGSPRTQQWFRFPFNFDPVWGPNTCAARSEVMIAEDITPSNPLAEILSLLR